MLWEPSLFVPFKPQAASYRAYIKEGIVRPAVIPNCRASVPDAN